MTKGLEKIIEELKKLGLTERQIINRLKLVKEEIEIPKLNDNEIVDDMSSYEYNRNINQYIYNGDFYIKNPSQPLIAYIKFLKTEYGARATLYFLTSVLSGGKIFSAWYHQRNDVEKGNYLMYLLKENLNAMIRDYNDGFTEIEEP